MKIDKENKLDKDTYTEEELQEYIWGSMIIGAIVSLGLIALIGLGIGIGVLIA